MLLFIRISSLDEQILCRISSFYCIQHMICGCSRFYVMICMKEKISC